VLRTLQEQDRAPTPYEQVQLSRWSSWGAVPGVFDEQDARYEQERAAIRPLLSDDGWDAAARTTINAHYTQPSYAAAMWTTLTDLGFTGGTVLEPGCGAGTFIGLAPASARMIGVELDPTTAAIAAQLYPAAQVRAESFADTRLQQQVDAVIGNVPFAQVKLHDRAYNPANLSMHNHFIVKSLALTKPGGIVAVLTSRFTLDAQNPAARREIAALGDLVGAVRLPTGAHSRTAGTSVVTDLLVLRRRSGPPPQDAPAWERSEQVVLDGEQVRVNRYFLDHPDQVLGTLSVATGQYASADLVVTSASPGAVTGDLTAALARVVARARADDLTYATTPAGPLVVQPAAQVGADPSAFVGHISAPMTGVFAQRGITGADDQLSVPATQSAELGRLLGLRDLTVTLLQTEASDLADSGNITKLRADLNTAYDAYVAEHGSLNRFVLRPTGRVDADGNPKTARLRPAVFNRFAGDPHSATVLALEMFDADTQSASKAAIFSQRVVLPRAPRSGADTPADAIAIAWDTDGELKLATVARLLGDPEDVARERLGTLVFDDPATGRLATAAEYLSGNVRTKLAAARIAASEQERYLPNVQALTAVIPVDLGPADIDARLGAAWIGPRDVEDFLRQTLETAAIDVEHTIGSDWKIRGSRAGGVLDSSTWGTERMPAHKLAESLLRQRPVRVMDSDPDGGTIFNPTETAAAQEKARVLDDRFAEWVWEDPARADRLGRAYNEKFNALVQRSYADTSHMSLPGLASTFTPRPHQREAVARMVAEPTAGLFHEVGAGKTAEMAMGVWEMRRLGLVNKPAIVVPNHMLDQFSREFLQLYPQARILAASITDLQADRRKLFVARAATGDWDAIIMTRTAFERLPVAVSEQERYLRAEVAPMHAALQARAAQADGPTVKRIQAQILAEEERIKKRLDKASDPAVTFEQTGIDYLVVDELHDYKNLATASNIPDAHIAGSDRATDLHMKVEALRHIYGGRCLTGATATPIANSVTEAYVMQRYLRPDLLREAGITDFDSWAGTFGQTVTDLEMSPDGGSWRLKTRFAKFRNIPEFLRMWAVAADVKTAVDLNLPTPDIAVRADGTRAAETVVVQPSSETRAYVASLGERAEKVRARAVSPREDNMLKISSDGRAAALDMRLVRGSDPSTGAAPTGLAAVEAMLLPLEGDADVPTKVDVAADRIAAIWRENTNRTYLDAAGNAHPRPGGLQMVFSDLGTPRETWNVYDELRDQLTARGVPTGQVAFIHTAATPREKERLFERCRTGDVQVLIGSTAKMGVGTNVQARAVALHHLDCPWRPADLAQREGRIVRQGNQNPEVQILRYVTQNTFDTYLWQTVERKAGFIGQIMGGTTSREIDDIGTNALDYNEVKALASGNPLLLDKAKADSEVSRLQRLRRAHDRQGAMLSHRISGLHDLTDQLRGSITQVEAALEVRTPAAEGQFRMKVADRIYSSRPDAAAALSSALLRHLAEPQTRYMASRDLGTVATLEDLPVHASTLRRPEGPIIAASIDGLPKAAITISRDDLTSPGHGIITRLENRAGGLDKTLTELRAGEQEAAAELTRAQATVGAPFKHQPALVAARAERDRLSHQLAAVAAPRAQPEIASPGQPSSAEPPVRKTRLASRLDAPLRGDQPEDLAGQPPQKYHPPHQEAPSV
jgi:N12 class adenine-specific DNA methylase